MIFSILATTMLVVPSLQSALAPSEDGISSIQPRNLLYSVAGVHRQDHTSDPTNMPRRQTLTCDKAGYVVWSSAQPVPVSHPPTSVVPTEVVAHRATTALAAGAARTGSHARDTPAIAPTRTNCAVTSAYQSPRAAQRAIALQPAQRRALQAQPQRQALRRQPRLWGRCSGTR
jgi:hypothetical protein